MIIIACTVGAISGMGGGVIIKPVFDFIGVHSVVAISFYSTVAVFTMSIVSTVQQVKTGRKFNWKLIRWISFGAVLGGILGNIAFEWLLDLSNDADLVQLVQISLTIVTLIISLLYSKYRWTSYQFRYVGWYLISGLLLGFLASLLGIGGGPINVSLMLCLFSLPIKEATIYSICTIFWSQLAKIIAIWTTGFDRYDMSILLYIIPASIIGGLVGAKVSHLLSAEKVIFVFQAVILFVLAINLYNGYRLL